jgi:hypothetical protein
MIEPLKKLLRNAKLLVSLKPHEVSDFPFEWIDARDAGVDGSAGSELVARG